MSGTLGEGGSSLPGPSFPRTWLGPKGGKKLGDFLEQKDGRVSSPGSASPGSHSGSPAPPGTPSRTAPSPLSALTHSSEPWLPGSPTSPALSPPLALGGTPWAGPHVGMTTTTSRQQRGEHGCVLSTPTLGRYSHD